MISCRGANCRLKKKSRKGLGVRGRNGDENKLRNKIIANGIGKSRFHMDISLD